MLFYRDCPQIELPQGTYLKAFCWRRHMKPIAATAFSGSRRDFFWLDSDFGMTASSPARGLGFDLHFGGIFTSVPTAVAAMAPRDSVVSTGGVFVGSAAPASGAGASLGSNARAVTASGPVGDGLVNTGGVLPLTQRLDLFGLGLDYSMFHKRFWGVFDKDDHLVPWQRLGGTFTSAPAAIAWAGNRIDVFGVGTDHAMFVKTSIGRQWTPDWLRLGGTFTSAATLVSRGPKVLELFARGADFTLRGNQTDGTTWFGFQNHGGDLDARAARRFRYRREGSGASPSLVQQRNVEQSREAEHR
jgi:hypothetical protein